MSVGNLGAVMNQLEGLIGTDLGTTGGSLGARSTQGLAMLPRLLREVLSRADFANTLNAKLYAPALNSAGANAISASGGNIIAIAWDNSQSATDAYIALYGVASGSVTIGTTQQSFSVFALRAAQGAILLPQPLVPLTNTGLAWDSTTNVNPGTSRSTVSTVTFMAVYTQ